MDKTQLNSKSGKPTNKLTQNEEPSTSKNKGKRKLQPQKAVASSSSTVFDEDKENVDIQNQASGSSKRSRETKEQNDDTSEKPQERKQIYYQRRYNEMHYSLLMLIKKKCRDEFLKLSKLQLRYVRILLQNAEVYKKKHDYSEDEKLLLLSIYKQSPIAYTRLRSKFQNMPSDIQLRQIWRNIKLDCGVTQTVKNYLSRICDRIKDEQKVCVLMWQEMAITPHVKYSKQKDKFIGFEDYGNLRTPKHATCALVFQLIGINSGWKQPISYYFASEETETNRLRICIKENIKAIQRAGFKIVATSCKREPNFVSAIDALYDKTKNSVLRKMSSEDGISFIVNKQEIVHVYDAPNLILNVRNHFLKKDILIEEKGEIHRGSWSHIIAVYNIHEENVAIGAFSTLRDITEDHIRPSENDKQKMKYLMPIFTSSMQLNLYLRAGKTLPSESLNTCKILNALHAVIDIANSSVCGQCPIRKPWTENSNHEKVCNDLIPQLNSMKFVDSTTDESLLLKQLTDAVKGLKFLFTTIKDLGISKFNTRYLLTESLEYFLDIIEAYSDTQEYPTAANFEDTFKTLVITRLTNINNPGFTFFDSLDDKEFAFALCLDPLLPGIAFAEDDEEQIDDENDSSDEDNFIKKVEPVVNPEDCFKKFTCPLM